ncbi:hypothetical protein IB642_06475 [Allofrancisella guangzhouensis]|uniref:Uncharacterized protein n=1 Tax=Allofrancisella guangzhouensis TaxID=594679 RepID=A0A0A8E6V0_9GAMM|nr:hypothetical protein [Allofrancisella guangzhouensis]AJC49327.1 hypothetical protein SD28_06665 [Allofrancisella guangzhouensis]MBK2027230.1 hypothetical protein [Allofrancisella guangzhouensis]MBK2044666.1 hypothetical protein [Allofrancisella guangzhouensis]MBK2045051.1 hypothetical protein [Allofrancisella guangzhouensis]
MFSLIITTIIIVLIIYFAITYDSDKSIDNSPVIFRLEYRLVHMFLLWYWSFGFDRNYGLKNFIKAS